MAWDWGGLSGPYYPFWPYYGYYDLGPVQIPPWAAIVGMTDRATGKVWYLGFDPNSNDRIALVDKLPLSTLITIRVFGPYDGPFIGSAGLRLGVRNARLVFDTFSGTAATPKAFNLAGDRHIWMEIKARAVKNPNILDHLTYSAMPVGILTTDFGGQLLDDQGNPLEAA